MNVETVLDILDHEFPDHKGELIHHNPFELLVAVMLSAQTTDARVNLVTPALFKAFPSVSSLASANVKDVEPYLNTLGLFHNKAKYLVALSKMLCERFGGVVPQSRIELESLPGVGRKTANVVLSEGFGIPAIAVDTHIERVAKRLGYAKSDASVLEVEKELMKRIPQEKWSQAHLNLLLFGRYYSTARNHEDVYVILEQLREKHNL